MFEADGDLEDFLFSSRGVDLDENRDQFYLHIPDTEYLAADPVNIPALPQLISSCVSDTERIPVAHLGGETPGSKQDLARSKARTASDLFSLLPHELRLMILEALDFDFHDILKLRSVSRVFWQIPQVAFQRLIRSTMPWFWEISELEPKLHQVDWCQLWDKLSIGSGGSGMKVAQIAVSRSDGIRLPNGRGIYPKYVAVDDYEARKRHYDQKQFQYERVFRRSFKKSKRGDSRLLGLINRRRIWNDIRQIIDEIERRKRN